MKINEEYGYLIVDGEIVKTGYIDLTDVTDILAQPDIARSWYDSCQKALEYVMLNWTTKACLSFDVTGGDKKSINVAVFRSVV